MDCRSRVVLILIVSLLLTNTVAAGLVGSTEGQFDVNPNGAATYAIPIKISSSINGMGPKLAVIYNSQQGNGLLGVGASLSGLSYISRCAATLGTDNGREGINFTAERFCLDGVRLINMCGKGGIVCDPLLREYRTEIESSSRVRAYGATASNPTHFKVWTKAGEVKEYGNTTDSNYKNASAQTLTWGVNKVTNRSNNYFTVTYKTDGQFVPERIFYNYITTNGTASSNRYLEFSYTTLITFAWQADVSPGFNGLRRARWG